MLLAEVVISHEQGNRMAVIGTIEYLGFFGLYVV
jgi:hypothetical protein